MGFFKEAHLYREKKIVNWDGWTLLRAESNHGLKPVYISSACVLWYKSLAFSEIVSSLNGKMNMYMFAMYKIGEKCQAVKQGLPADAIKIATK